MKKLIAPHPYFEDYSVAPNDLPTIFYVETVMACNLSCPECVIGVDNVDRTKQVLRLPQFEIISKKIEPYAKLVYLHKWGEPLMNKKIVEMITMTSKYAHSHISTNGMLINKQKAEDLITSGLGTLIISIDGFTQGVYEQYRIGGQVKQVMETITLLTEINNHYGNPVKILPQFIVFEHNYHEIEEFKAFCDNLSLQAIFKKPYIRYGAVKESHDPDYQRVKYKTKEEHLDAISSCHFATCEMTITVNGKLLLCPQDYNGEWPLGNMLDEESTVESLWNNAYYRSIRKDKIMKKCPPEICTDRCMIYNPEFREEINIENIAKV